MPREMEGVGGEGEARWGERVEEGGVGGTEDGHVADRRRRGDFDPHVRSRVVSVCGGVVRGSDSLLVDYEPLVEFVVSGGGRLVEG